MEPTGQEQHFTAPIALITIFSLTWILGIGVLAPAFCDEGAGLLGPRGGRTRDSSHRVSMSIRAL